METGPIIIIELNDDMGGLEEFMATPPKSSFAHKQEEEDALAVFMPTLKPKFAPLAEKPLFTSYYTPSQSKKFLGRAFAAAISLLSLSTPHNQTVSEPALKPVPVVRAAYDLGLHPAVSNETGLISDEVIPRRTYDLTKLERAAQRGGMTGLYHAIYGKEEAGTNIYQTSEMKELYSALEKPVFSGRLLNNIEVTKEDVAKIYAKLTNAPSVKSNSQLTAISEFNSKPTTLESTLGLPTFSFSPRNTTKAINLEDNVVAAYNGKPKETREEFLYHAANNGAITGVKTLKNGKQIFNYDNDQIAEIAHSYGLTTKYTKSLIRNAALMQYLQ